MATASDNSLFQDMVLELQLSNSILPKIEANTYETGLALQGGVNMTSSGDSGRLDSGNLEQGRTLEKIESNTSGTTAAIVNLTDVVSYNLEKMLKVMIGNKLQDEENRREMLAALMKGSSRDRGPIAMGGSKKAASGRLGPLGMITQMISQLAVGMGSLILGFFAGIASDVKKIFLSTRIGAKIGGFISSGIGRVVEFFSSILKAIKGSKIFVASSGGITKAIDGISRFFKPIGDVVKLFAGGGRGRLSRIASSIKLISENVLKVAGPMFRLGKVLGRLFLPLNILLSVFDTFMGGIKGFNESGFAGMMKGGLKGFLVGLVGAPLDILKSVTSWIAGKLGFNEVEKYLDSLNFSQMIKDFVDKIFKFGEGVFEKIFEPIMDIYTQISTAISSGTLWGSIKSWFSEIFAAPLNMLKEFGGKIAGVLRLDTLKEKISGFSLPSIFRREGNSGITNDDLSPSPLFSPRIADAYNESSQKRMTGAEINATQSATAEMEAAAASAPVMVANSPTTVAPSINSSSQSITVNSSTHQERTNLLLMPSYAGF